MPESLDFSEITESDLQLINFSESGYIDGTPLKTNHFQPFFSAIANSNLKKSVKFIEVTNCGLKLSELNSIKSKSKLPNV